MRMLLIVILIAVLSAISYGFTTIKGGTFKGGKFTKENSDLPDGSILFINGDPWRGYDGSYIVGVD